MKIRDLYEKKIEELEALTDAELEEWFNPFLQFTKPPEGKKSERGKAPKPRAKKNKSTKDLLADVAKQIEEYKKQQAGKGK